MTTKFPTLPFLPPLNYHRQLHDLRKKVMKNKAALLTQFLLSLHLLFRLLFVMLVRPRLSFLIFRGSTVTSSGPTVAAGEHDNVNRQLGVV